MVWLNYVTWVAYKSEKNEYSPLKSSHKKKNLIKTAYKLWIPGGQGFAKPNVVLGRQYIKSISDDSNRHIAFE